MSVAPRMGSNLRRRHVAAFMARLPEHVERLTWDATQIARHREAALRRLLAVAIERSPFHARRLRGLDPASFRLEDLAQLPVMSKSEMMNDLDAVLTDRRLGRALLERHLAGLGSGVEYLLDEYVVMASGGSSGERGVFVYGFDAFVDFALSLLRGLLVRIAAGASPGAPPLSAAMIAGGTAVHATAALSDVLARGGPIEVTSLSAATPLDELVERLNGLQPRLLVGYPSILIQLAAEQQAGRLRIRPLAVGATSEILTPEMAAEIVAAFGPALTNTFGSTEGLCGASVPGAEPIVFACDNCIAELVGEDGRPVPPGVPSARVLVTNLYNPTQPLIRYVLTDHFTEQPAASGHGHLRALVTGRADAPFRYGRLELHPITVRAELVKTPDVFEYQVRQTPVGIDVDVVARSELDVAALERRLVAALGAAGLDRPRVGVRPVRALARSPLTGKARRFVPLS